MPWYHSKEHRHYCILPQDNRFSLFSFEGCNNQFQFVFFCSVSLPNEEVDENDERKGKAAAAGVSGEEKNEVTERTERQHPQHEMFKEKEKAVHPSQH